MEALLSELLMVMNVVGVVAFSASGASKGVSKGLDLLGIIVLGIVTSFAGGITADLLLGIIPPAILVNPGYLGLSVATSLAVFLLGVERPRGRPLELALIVGDAIGLAAFATYGAQLAVYRGLNVVSVMIIAAIVGTGGGVLRDVLVREVPVVLSREVYATAAMAGGLAYYALYAWWPRSLTYAVVGSLAVTAGLRLSSVFLGLSLPRARTQSTYWQYTEGN